MLIAPSARRRGYIAVTLRLRVKPIVRRREKITCTMSGIGQTQAKPAHHNMNMVWPAEGRVGFEGVACTIASPYIARKGEYQPDIHLKLDRAANGGQSNCTLGKFVSNPGAFEKKGNS